MVHGRKALHEQNGRDLLTCVVPSPRPLHEYEAQVETLRGIVAGLSTLSVRCIVTLGESIRPGEVQGTENARVLVSAPHTELLRQASVLVTHWATAPR